MNFGMANAAMAEPTAELERGIRHADGSGDRNRNGNRNREAEIDVYTGIEVAR